MVIIDTTVWIDYLRAVENPEMLWLDSQLQRRRMGLTDLILCEVLQGISNERHFIQVQRDLLKFQIFNTGESELAIAAANNYRDLRANGHIVRKTIEYLIGTFCLLGKHELLHRDRDFDSFEKVLGLKVVRPAA